MNKRFFVSVVLLVISYLAAKVLLGEATVSEYPGWYQSLIVGVAVIAPTLGYAIWGGKGLLYGALVALAFNILDALFLKRLLLGDAMPQTQTGAPNLFGILPVNLAFVIAGVVTFVRGRKKRDI